MQKSDTKLATHSVSDDEAAEISEMVRQCLPILMTKKVWALRQFTVPSF